jgi:hypothetical protein
MNFIVAQLGARMQYAVPRKLHQAGILEHFYTDICAVKGWPRLLHTIPPRLRPAAVKRLLGRVPEGVPRHKITAFNKFEQEYAQRRSQVSTMQEGIVAHLWAGHRFCDLILHNLTGN